jgi:hypothetical protein
MIERDCLNQRRSTERWKRELGGKRLAEPGSRAHNIVLLRDD